MASKDSKDIKEGDSPKKKGGMMKLILIGVGVLVIFAGGIGGGLYAMQSGMIGGGHGEPSYERPRLLPKSEQKGPATAGEGHGEGGGGEKKLPLGEGGDKYASTYYVMEKEFTANLRDSVHFVQLGLALSTPYDERVIDSVKTHEIAVRSAVLLALTDATEDQVFSADGKRKLQIHLTHAINDILKQKEGFGGVGNVYFTSFVVQ